MFYVEDACSIMYIAMRTRFYLVITSSGVKVNMKYVYVFCLLLQQ